MGFWNGLVNGLVFLFAAAFVVIGVSFILFPLTGTTPVGDADAVEGGPAWGKAVLGAIFLLAAAPMFYYVFSKNAKGLPPARKKRVDEAGPRS